MVCKSRLALCALHRRMLLVASLRPRGAFVERFNIIAPPQAAPPPPPDPPHAACMPAARLLMLALHRQAMLWQRAQ